MTNCPDCSGLGAVEGIGFTWSARPEEISVAIPCRRCQPEAFVRFYKNEAKRTGNDDLVAWAEAQIQ